MAIRSVQALRLIPMALLIAACLALTGCGGTSSSSTPVAPTAGTGGSGLLAGNYPSPQDFPFQGCPPQGDGGDSQLNIRKNRTDTAAWQPVAVPSLVSLAYPATVAKQPRASWSSQDTQAVAQSEGRPVQAEGYLLLVRHEGPESPNCHDANARDFHMWLANAPGGLSDRANSMIVEVTPRSRALNAGWQPDSRLLGLTGQHVRISGWLMLDQEHPEQVGKTRGTLWEIHPVMKIEVDRGGNWINLNDTTLQISGGSANGSYGGSGSYNGGYSGTPATGSHHHRHHHTSSSG